MKPKLAIQTIMWNNNRLEEHFSEIFDEVKLAGYDGVECRYTIAYQEEKVKSYLATNMFEIVALHIALENFDPTTPVVDLDDLLARMNRLNISKLLVSLGSKQDMAQYRYWVSVASSVGKLCAARNVQLCYHNHDWEFTDGFTLHDEIANASNVYMAMDIAWVHRANLDITEVLERYADRIRYVHIKDTENNKWKELGCGVVDLKAALKAIAKLELPWWTVEQDQTEQLPLNSATISRVYLRENGY